MVNYDLGRVVGADGRGIEDIDLVNNVMIITFDDGSREEMEIGLDIDLSDYVNIEDVVDAITNGDTNPVTSNAVYNAIHNLDLEGYISAEDVADAVTDGNTNPVTSNAVYDAIHNIQVNGVTVDDELKNNSANPVQNQIITNALNNKVDKQNGKGLSTNDYTNADKTLVGEIPNKVDKISGKSLSQNDYTNADKALVDTISGKANASDVANTYATKQQLAEAQFNGGSNVDLSGYLKTSDIATNLSTDSDSKVLSAKQGKNLNDNKVDKANGASQLKDATAYSNIGSSANATQANINSKVDSFIYGNGQAILAIETNLLELTGQLNDLETNLANFNDALLNFDGDTETARDNLAKLKENLQAILNKISDLQHDNSEFSSFLTQFEPKLNTLDTTLSALYQGLTNFEGTLEDFEEELRSNNISIQDLDDGLVALLQLIFKSKEDIKAVEDDIGDENTPDTLWYHISQITTDLDENEEGSLAYLVKEAYDIIGDEDTPDSVLYILNQILNTDIPTLQGLMYGSGVDDNGNPYSKTNPKPDSLFYLIDDIKNNTIVELRASIAQAKSIADDAKSQATALATTISTVEGELWGSGASNDAGHPSSGSVLGRIGAVETSVSGAETSLWGNGNQANPQAGSLWARLKAIYNPDNNTGSLVDLENDINNTVMYSVFCVNKDSTVVNPAYFVPPGVPVWICVQAIVHGEDAPQKSKSEIPITITDSNNNTISLEYTAWGTGNLSGLYIYEYTPSTTGILTIACFNQRTTLHVTGTAPSVSITDITSTIFTKNNYSAISMSTSLQEDSYIDFYHDDETRLCELYFSAWVDVDNTTGANKWGHTGWSVPSAYAPKRDLYCHDTSNPNHLALIRSASSSYPLAIEGYSSITDGAVTYGSNHKRFQITFHAIWTF